MSSRYFVTLTAVVLSLMLFLPAKSFSQIIRATGSASEASSQLVFYYDQTEGDGDTKIQVTNGNDTTPVTIHVQIFRSFETGDDTAPAPVFCDERDFVDLLTPNDTHIYDLDNDEFPKNEGETELDAGELTSIDVNDTKGFVVITPVVSEADLTAISFQYLFGTMQDEEFGFLANTMGRDAVDFATGEIVADGTPLDGVTNGFVVLQPGELVFNFAGEDDGDAIDIVGIAFVDVYGSPGLLGYRVDPGSTTWTSFIFDWKEDPTSCGQRTVECFLTVGLNETFGQNNEEFTPGDIPDDLLCAGSDTPFYNNGEIMTGNFDETFDQFGWTRIFVSGYNQFTNLLSFIAQSEGNGATWSYTN